jgi:hypothetical protein
VTACALATTPALAQIIVDDFEVDSSANYTVANDGSPNGTQAFAFDYVAAGIPPAPRSMAGDVGGLLLTANDSAGATDAWTLFHNTSVDVTHYKLTVDVWMNFAALAGSTEHAHVGVGGNGATFNSLFTPISGSGAFIAFTGDGGSISDYRWFRDAANTPAGDSFSTTLPNDHPSYLGHGSNGSGAYFQALFPSPPATIAGSPGNIWTTLEVDVDNAAGQISFLFDGSLTFQGDFANTFDGFVSLGLADVFGSVSGASNVFTVFDNLEVVEVPPTAIGTTYCSPANFNSTGSAGVITATGSDVAMDNNLTLTASSLPDGQFAYFIGAMGQAFIPMAGGSQGNLCVGSPTVRFNLQVGQITGGMFAIQVDTSDVPLPPNFNHLIVGGETWDFQCWYRDVNPNPTSNFTDGVEIAFQ